MNKTRLLGAVCACLTLLSFNANASVLRTLNSVDYEWLELTATAGLSRDQVEVQIAAATPGDLLYGYEYASRALVEDLLLSYSTWDGINYYHGESSVVSGMVMFLDDFGRTTTDLGNGFNSTFNTVDGYSVQIDGYSQNGAYFGASGECGASLSCLGLTRIYNDNSGTPQMVSQVDIYGWDSLASVNGSANNVSNSIYGSHLVRVSTVPVPAAVWLFGSGLLGLIGISRRKKSA